MWANLYGAGGYCHRPAAGYVKPRKLSDPFLPNISAQDYCGDHMTFYAVKMAANPRNRAIRSQGLRM